MKPAAHLAREGARKALQHRVQCVHTLRNSTWPHTQGVHDCADLRIAAVLVSRGGEFVAAANTARHEAVLGSKMISLQAKRCRRRHILSRMCVYTLFCGSTSQAHAGPQLLALRVGQNEKEAHASLAAGMCGKCGKENRCEMFRMPRIASAETSARSGMHLCLSDKV